MGKTFKTFYKVALLIIGMLGVFFYLALEGQKERDKAKEKIDFTRIGTEQGLVQNGRKIFFGKGRCAGCHSLGRDPTTQRAPGLFAVGDRLTRDFMYESLTDPEAYIKKNFDPPEPKNYSMTMPASNRPPIGLSENEMLAVIAFLQSQGGKVTISPADLTPAKGG